MIRSLLGAASVVVVLAPALAAARVVRAPCRDGVLPPALKCVAGCARPASCDTDRQCDGTCTYLLRVCPRPGVVGPQGCVDHTRAVAVGTRDDVTLQAPQGLPTRFVLRCRAHPRGIRCPAPPTTSTTGPVATSTTTTASITTTTGPPCGMAPGPCCSDGSCAQGEVCVAGSCDICGFLGHACCPPGICHSYPLTHCVNGFCHD